MRVHRFKLQVSFYVELTSDDPNGSSTQMEELLRLASTAPALAHRAPAEVKQHWEKYIAQTQLQEAKKDLVGRWKEQKETEMLFRGDEEKETSPQSTLEEQRKQELEEEVTSFAVRLRWYK